MGEEKWNLEKIDVSGLAEERKSGENKIYGDIAVAIVYRKGIDVKVVHTPILRGILARVGPNKSRFYLTWDSCLAVMMTVYGLAQINSALSGKIIWLEINDAIEKSLFSKNP